MRKTIQFSVHSFVAIAALPLMAQLAPGPELREELDRQVRLIAGGASPTLTDRAVVLYMADRLRLFEQAVAHEAGDVAADVRTDQQLGSPSNSPSAVSTAERPGIADLLQIAIERGAINKSSSGTGLNLSTTPYAFWTAFGASDTPRNWEKSKLARNISISGSFSSEDAATGDFSSFTSGQVKWIILGNRSARDPALIREIRPVFASAFSNIDSALNAACKPILDADDIDTARDVLAPRLAAAGLTAAEVTAALDQSLGPIVDRLSPDTIRPCAEAVMNGFTMQGQALDQSRAATKKYLEQNKAQQLSVAALYVRDAAISDYYTAKVLWAIDRGTPLTVNINGEVNLNRNDAAPEGKPIDRVRSYSLEAALNSQRFANGRLDAVFAGKWSRAQDSDDDSVVIQEARLNIHLSDTAKLPLSITYATNESETIRSGWQFNFAFSALLDQFLMRNSPPR